MPLSLNQKPHLESKTPLMLFLISIAWIFSKWAQEEYPETTGQGLNKHTESNHVIKQKPMKQKPMNKQTKHDLTD